MLRARALAVVCSLALVGADMCMRACRRTCPAHKNRCSVTKHGTELRCGCHDSIWFSMALAVAIPVGVFLLYKGCTMTMGDVLDRVIPHRVQGCLDDWCKQPPLLRERAGKVAFALVLVGMVLMGVGGTVLPNVMIPEAFNAEWHARLTMHPDDWGCEYPNACRRKVGEAYWEQLPEANEGNDKTWEFVYGASRAEDLIARSPKLLFHVWHVLNPREVAVGGARPRLQQRGPYAYARVAERTAVLLSKESVQYKETSFLSPIRGAYRGINGTDACKVLYAQLGRRAGADREPFPGARGSGEEEEGSHAEPAACADDSEEVTVLNLAFLKLAADCPWGRAGAEATMGVGRCSSRRALQHLFGRVASEVWGQQAALLGTSGLVKLLRVHRAPRLLGTALRNARLLKAPWVVATVLRSLELNFDGAPSTARSKAEASFRGQTGAGIDLVCGWVNVTVGGGGNDDPATPRAGLGQPRQGGEGWLQPRTAVPSSMDLGEFRIQTSGVDTDWGGWREPHASRSGKPALCRLTVLPQCDYLRIGIAGDGGVGGSQRDAGEAARAMRSELASMKEACKAKVKRVRALCSSTGVCPGVLLAPGQARHLLDGKTVQLMKRAQTAGSMPALPRPVVAGDGSLFGGGLNGVRRWVGAAAYRGAMRGGSFAGGPGQRVGVSSVYAADYRAAVTMMCGLAGKSVNATSMGELCALQVDLVLHSVFGAFGYADVGFSRPAPNEPAYILATADTAYDMAPSAPMMVVDPASWAEHPITHLAVAADVSAPRSLDFGQGSQGSSEQQRGRRMPCVWRWDGAAANEGADGDTAVRIDKDHDAADAAPRCSLEFAPYAPHIDPTSAAETAKRKGIAVSLVNEGRAQLSQRATRAIFDADPHTHGELSFFHGADGFVLNASHVASGSAASAWRVAAHGQGGALAPGLRTLWLPAFAVCDNERNLGIGTACAEMKPGREALARLTALLVLADGASANATDEATAAAVLETDDALRANYEAQVCTAAGMIADLAGVGTAPHQDRGLVGRNLGLGLRESALADSAGAGFAADIADVLASVPGMELRRSAATAAVPNVTTAVVKTWPVLTRHTLQQLGYAQFGSGAVSRMLLGVDSVADAAGMSAFLAGSRSAGKQGVLGGGDVALRAEFPAAALRMGWVATEPARMLAKHSAVPGQLLGGAWTLRRSEAELLLRTLSGVGGSSLTVAHEVNAKLAALGADVAAALVSGDAGAAKRACAADVPHLSATESPGRQSTAMPAYLRPLLNSTWPRASVPSAAAASARGAAAAVAAMPAAVGVNGHCTRGALLAAMADAWVRDFFVTFSCPGYTMTNNSLPREGCTFSHSGMFITVTARRFLFDGYIDPFASYLAQRAIERTDPTMHYQCHSARRFVFRTMSFAAAQAAAPMAAPAGNGTVEPKEAVDPFLGKVAISMASTAAAPLGWSFGHDDRCRPIDNLDCSDSGYEITVSGNIRYLSSDFAWKPMVFDRENKGTIERQVDLYFPFKDEWFLPEILLPTSLKGERIGDSSGRKFVTSRILSPVYAAFLGATNRDAATQSHRNCMFARKYVQQCDLLPPVKDEVDEVRLQKCNRDVAAKLAPTWAACGARVDSGPADASSIGKLLLFRGGRAVSYLQKDADGTGAPVLGDVYANGWQGKANAHLWGGFETAQASHTGVGAAMPHSTLRYALADALLDKDGDMGGALPLELPFDGVHTQAYRKGDDATGATKLKFLAEVDLLRYCVTKDAWARAREAHDQSLLATSAAETARAEGDPRVPVPLGMIDLEPSVGWPLVLSLPFFLGDEQWDAANSPAKDFEVIGASPEHATTAHRHYHNTCYFHEPITGRFMRMEQRTQWNVQIKRSPLFPNLFLPTVYFPAFWGEKLFVIDPIDTERFQDDVLVTKGLAELVRGLGIGFGVVVFLFGVALGLKANGDMKRRDAEEREAMNFAQPKRDQLANQKPLNRTLEI